MEGYQRFWIPLGNRVDEMHDWHVLHPSLNQTGTDTLRLSSSSPNEQNVSKQEGFNLRYVFGPPPGWEWWSMDAKNLELRIPAYEAGEKDVVHIFDHPDDPPYYGSYHLLVFDLLYPDLFREHGKKCKDLFEATHYQWVKNGNFAVIYGAQEGTADATYRVRGAFRKVRHRFPRIAKLSDRQLELARRLGYVETIPDKTVDPRRGYPLLASRSQDGYVLPTVPLNYHIQGTAMWWARKGMIRSQAQLLEWRARGFDARMVLQVHDEIVYAMPRRADPRTNPKASNLAKAKVLARLLEQGGEDIGVPTPVGIEWHPDNWSVGHALD
jgi:DNA polymerase I-like protein with 3'-5' exonuclease and polymerase domains